MTTPFILTRRMFRAVLMCMMGIISLAAGLHTPVARAHPLAGGGQTVLPSGSGVAIEHAVIAQASGSGTQVALAASQFAPLAGSTVNLQRVAGLTSTHGNPPLQVTTIPAPTSISSSAQNGIDQKSAGGVTPSDANGVAGSASYIETTNRVFDIFSRAGVLLYSDTYLDWFKNIRGSQTTLYDPNVVWDASSNLYVFSVVTGVSVLLSVSKIADPRGPSDFCLYSFPTLAGLGSDFDKLGFNSAGFYLSVNENVGGGPVNNELFYLNRQQLESCANSVNYTTWSRLTNLDGTIAQAIVPAVQYTSSSGSEYMINSKPAGACNVTLWTLNPSVSPPQLSRVTVNTACYSPPPNAPQANTSATIYPGDSSVSHVTFVNGVLTLVVSGSHDFGDGNGPVGIAEWFIINPTASTKLVNAGAFGTRGVWLLYPAVVRTFAGQLMFVYDASSVNMSPSLWAVEFVNGTYNSPVAIAWGKSAFGKSGGQPWGDYQSAWLDPSGPNTNAVWLTGQYASDSGIWGTSYALITP